MTRSNNTSGVEERKARTPGPELVDRVRGAIPRSEGFVSLASVARDCKLSATTVFEIAHAVPGVTREIERANERRVASLDRSEALRLIGRASPAGVSSSPAAMRGLHAHLDAELDEALRSLAGGIPSTRALATGLNERYGTRFSGRAVHARLEANPRLADLAARRALHFIGRMGLAELLATLAKAVALRTLDARVRRTAYERLDGFIAQAIAATPGIPSLHGVVAELRRSDPAARIDRTTVKARFAANAQLGEQYESEGARRIRELDDAQVRRKIARKGGTRVPPALEPVLEERIRAYLARVIRESEAILTPHELARLAGLHTPAVLLRELARCAPLRSELEERHAALIAAMDAPAVVHTRLCALERRNLSARNRNRLQRRFELVVGDALDACDGPPSTFRVARSFGVAERELADAFEQSPRLLRLLQSRAKRWFRHLDAPEAVAMLSRKATHLTAEQRSRMLEVLDAHLVDCLRGREDPGRADLAAAAGVGATFVRERLAANLAVFRAFWHAHGFSDDQIIERFLGPPVTLALRGLMEERLRHIRPYRVLLALTRAARTLFRGALLELSLYPAPLTAVAEDSGFADPDLIRFQWLEPYRRGEPVRLPRCDTALIQGAHRLREKVLTSVVREVHDALKKGGRLIVTYRPGYVATKRVREAFAANGFELRDDARVSFEVSGKRSLEAAGLGPTQAKRVRAKIAGTAGVLVFDKTRRSARPPSVPGFRRDAVRAAPVQAPRPSMTVDVPASVHRGLVVRFTSSSIDVEGVPFLIELRRRGRTVVLFAFGLNPDPPARAEYAVFEGAPAGLDYGAWVRRLADDARLRERVLAGRQEVRLSLSSFERLLGDGKRGGRS